MMSPIITFTQTKGKTHWEDNQYNCAAECKTLQKQEARKNRMVRNVERPSSVNNLHLPTQRNWPAISSYFTITTSQHSNDW